MKRKASISVYPRYTPGSPGRVSLERANKVIESEKNAFKHAIEGRSGQNQKKRAEILGCSGIVESVLEIKGNKFEICDLITKEVYTISIKDRFDQIKQRLKDNKNTNV